MGQEEALKWCDWSDCTNCALCVYRKRVVSPRGRAGFGVMLVGEAPGETEEREGRVFVGRSGKLLDAWLEYLGLTEEDIYVTNVVKCRPPGNRDPTPEEIEACRPWLVEEIRTLSPRVIIPLGRFAREVVSRMRGEVFSEECYGLALKHPAWYLRRGELGVIPTAELNFLKKKVWRV